MRILYLKMLSATPLPLETGIFTEKQRNMNCTEMDEGISKKYMFPFIAKLMNSYYLIMSSMNVKKTQKVYES